MRILIVHNFYRWHGGEDDVVERLSAMLAERGHAVELFAADSRELESASVARRVSASAGAIYSPRMAVRLSRAVMRFRPDLVHVHNVFPLISPSSYWTLHRRHVPVVQTVHNFRFLCPNGLAYTDGAICFRCRQGNTFPAMQRRCLHGDLGQSVLYGTIVGTHRRLGTFGAKTGHLLAVNTLLARMLREEFPSASVEILPNYIDTRRYQPRDEFGPSFVYMGRLSEEKGVHILLEAVRLSPRLQLHVVGDGPLRQELEGKARAWAGTRVTFHGFLQGEARFQILGRAAALVIPSLYHDPCPMVALEAMALGVPVVATRRGGLPDMVEDGETGRLVEAGRPDELARAMERLAGFPETIARFGKAARERAVVEFDVEVHYRRLMNAYYKTLEHERANARSPHFDG